MPNSLKLDLPLRERSVSLVEEKYSDEIEKFLKPLVIFLNILGIPLVGLGISRNTIADRIFRCTGWLLLLLNIGFNFNVIYGVIHAFLTNTILDSSTFSGSVLMAITVSTVTRILSQVTLLMLSGSPRQIKLAETMRQLSFRGLKIRKKSAIAFSSICFVEYLLTTSLFIVNNALGNNFSISSVDLLRTTAKELFSLYSAGAEYFYIIICLLAIELFRQMRIEMEEGLKGEATQRLTINEVEFLIRKWKERYSVLIQLVDCISECFNLILLEFTILYSINIMNGTYFTAVLFKKNFRFCSAFNAYYVILCITYLVLITYLPTRIKSEAISMSNVLRHCGFKEPELQHKVNFFLIEVMQSLPSVSVFGLFDAHTNILPAMCGTILTYIVITFQFQIAENGK